MLKKLRELLAAAPADDNNAADGTRGLRVATAALLVEMSRADFAESGAERDEILAVLSKHFALDLEDAEALIDRASERADESVSLHEFTRLLHEQLDHDEKCTIVEMLWRVALADAQLDRYEDYLVRKIAELLYVSHSDLMRLKHKVLGELDSGD